LTIIEIALLLGGCFILIFGISGFFHRGWERYVDILMIIIGLILIYLPTLGPLSGIKKRISAITEINSSQVEFIVLQPTRRNEVNVYTLIEKDTVITDRNAINEICEKLRKAKVLGHQYDENRGGRFKELDQQTRREACRVEIHYFDKNLLSFGITNVWDLTKINFSSNGESGWKYATLEASELGLLLMKYWTTTDLKQQ